jgi:hypothetical protein
MFSIIPRQHALSCWNLRGILPAVVRGQYIGHIGLSGTQTEDLERRNRLLYGCSRVIYAWRIQSTDTAKMACKRNLDIYAVIVVTKEVI